METQANATKQLVWKRHREKLLQEGMSGKTEKDSLPNDAYPLRDEAEAMYFKGARDFLRTSLAYNILCRHQDLIDKCGLLKEKA